MPAHPHHTIRQGSRSRSILVFAGERSNPSRGRTGVRPDVSAARGWFVRAGEARARAMTLSPGTPDSFIPGGWHEVDADLAPGVYRFGIPNTVLAEGSPQVLLGFEFPGARVDPIEIALVAYDPQEPERIGMECQVWEVRQEFLRQGLPRLAEMELRLQGDARVRRAPADVEEGVGDAGP
jgi:hypothetical protein